MKSYTTSATFEEILSFQMHVKSDTLKLICMLPPDATTDWCFLPCKEFRSHQNCGFLKHSKIQTENQVNPVVVNCWMKNWNGGFVMCALVHNESQHSQKKPNLFWWIFITFLHHSLTYLLDSVNRANFWDPTKSLYFNPEWSTTRLVNHCPNATKWNCYIDLSKWFVPSSPWYYML